MQKGPDSGKLAVIVDILDHNRAIIDGPTTGVARQAFPYRHMYLTKIVIAVPRSAKTGVVAKLLAKEDIQAKWNQTARAKKTAYTAKKASMTDFDRFKQMVLQKKKRSVIKKAFSNLKESAGL